MRRKHDQRGSKPRATLKGSVLEYHGPFEPASSDWEVLLLGDLTSDTAHADEVATPSMRELGEDESKP